MSKDKAFEMYLSVGIGKENAVKRDASSKDDRTFRELLKIEREQGRAIIPSPNGYYIVDPKRKEEVDALRVYINKEHHRLYELKKTLVALDKTYLKMMRAKEWEKDGLNSTEVC